MLTKKFFQDAFERYGFKTPKEMYSFYYSMGGNFTRSKNPQWNTDYEALNGHAVAMGSPTTCGFGELGRLFTGAFYEATARPRILQALIIFLVTNRSLVVYHTPKMGNYEGISKILEEYGFHIQQEFLNHNSGNVVVQFQNNIAGWSAYDEAYRPKFDI